MATTDEVRQQLMDLVGQAASKTSGLLDSGESSAAHSHLEVAKLAAETLKVLGEQPNYWLDL